MNSEFADRRGPIQEEGAAKLLQEMDDPIAGELMKLCLAAARMRFVRWEGLSSTEWEARLPKSPFDMEFFACVLKDVFSKREVLERVLRGETVASATGWEME